MNDDEFKLLMAKAMLDLQNKMSGLTTLFKDNMDFITGMGDVAEALAGILTNAMDKYDIANKLALDQLYKSSEFFKNTISNKYSNQNIVQEWFSDVVVDIIVQLSKYDKEYVFQWLDLKFKDWYHEKQILPANLTYEERAEFGEAIFKSAVQELKANIMLVYVCRTLYIPFLSIYYLRPMTDYPYYKEWLDELAKSRRIFELKEKFGTFNFYEHLDKTDQEIEEMFKSKQENTIGD